MSKELARGENDLVNEEKNSSGVGTESLVSQGHGSSDWFTPGPWQYDGGERIGGPNVLPRWSLYWEAFPDTTGMVGTGIVTHSRGTFAYVSANENDMRLIAAAPSLYNALIATHACATVRDDGTCDGCIVSDALSLVAQRTSA